MWLLPASVEGSAKAGQQLDLISAFCGAPERLDTLTNSGDCKKWTHEKLKISFPSFFLVLPWTVREKKFGKKSLARPATRSASAGFVRAMLEKGGDGDIGSRRNRFGGQAILVSKYLLANLTQEIPIDTLGNALFGGNP